MASSGLRDALAAFSHLAENLPTWINELSDLQTHTDAKRQEFIDDFKKHGTVRARRRKGSSLCSIRTENKKKQQDPPEPEEKDAPEQTSEAADGGPKSRNPRKRHHPDDSSAVSVNQSIVSTRHNLIIHYDCHTQDVLTEMVKRVSLGRNKLRAARRSQGPPSDLGRGRLLSSRALRMRRMNNSLLNSIVDSEEEDNGQSQSNSGAPDDPDEPPKLDMPFESVDKMLEVAHSLCETAAYHFLRLGDCSKELHGIKESFVSIKDTTTGQVDRIKGHMKQYNLSEAEPEPEPQPQAKPSQAESSKPKPAGEGESSQASLGAIEVDDESSTESAEPVDISAFRVTRMNRR
ncbi:hypothetical protein PHISCL_07846 [Aspergillus sclerotialis]|uniref:Uncharacterized protein n=1 Tax=Aspergillus sclerotialis TaxID=2070753 RepID=A0A3A2ZPJ3_9EURO|nr:hypothetical protein PHISCL_07846 [Aspergillus sclerotialis]